MIIHCYNKESEKAVKKQLRDNKGKFTKRKIILPVIGIITVLVLTILGVNFKKWFYVDTPCPEEQILTIDTAKEILAKKKTEFLDILRDCECNPVKYPNQEDCIVWEEYGVGKNRASWGRYMWKIGTIQNFKPELSEYQALLLAMDENKARALVEEVVFSNINAIYNWKNCNEKNNLYNKLQFIYELQEEIKNNEDI